MPTDQATRARAAAMQFEAKKHELRQLQNGEWKITFSIHPNEMPDPIMRATMGTRYQLVAVELDDDETPVVHEEQNGKQRRRWGDLKPSQQAGIRCDDEAFRRFLEVEVCGTLLPSSFNVADAVRSICGVTSRRQFDDPGLAQIKWAELDHNFQIWLGTPEL